MKQTAAVVGLRARVALRPRFNRMNADVLTITLMMLGEQNGRLTKMVTLLRAVLEPCTFVTRRALNYLRRNSILGRPKQGLAEAKIAEAKDWLNRPAG